MDLPKEYRGTVLKHGASDDYYTVICRVSNNHYRIAKCDAEGVVISVPHGHAVAIDQILKYLKPIDSTVFDDASVI
jgi:hypothetical protein